MSEIVFSVVVPVFNEVENLPELYRRLTDTLISMGEPYEIVFIDDGSGDGSFELLKKVQSGDPHVVVVKLTRNFGQHPAIVAGLQRARGKAVVLIDADLQNPPEEIPRLCEKYREGYDVVYGIRKGREDAAWRIFGSKFVMLLSEKLLGMRIPQDMISGFRIIDRKVVNALNSIREQQYDTSLMMVWLGFSHAGIIVRHDDRLSGGSKYSTLKLIYLTLDMLVGFSDLPLRAASIAGSVLAFAAMLIGAYMAMQRIRGVIDVPGYASVFVGVTFLAGIQLLFLGVIGEYIARIYREMKGRPYYVIDQVCAGESRDFIPEKREETARYGTTKA